MIEYVTYKGEKIPLRISYYVLKMYKEETGQSVFETENNQSSWEIILKYAVEAGYKAIDKPLPEEYNNPDPKTWVWMLDECYPEFLEKAQKFFLALIPQMLPNLKQMQQMGEAKAMKK
jgi:hypothetical protein